MKTSPRWRLRALPHPPQPSDQTRSQHVTHVCFCMWCHSSAWTVLVCVPACEPAGRTDLPMTKVVIRSLLAPCLFLTSQTKVVLTALSTFFTVSLLSSTDTVSGSDPDILDRKERIFSDLARDKEMIEQKKNEAGLTRSRWLSVRGWPWPSTGAWRPYGRRTSCCRSLLWIQTGGLKHRQELKRKLSTVTLIIVIFLRNFSAYSLFHVFVLSFAFFLK